MNAYSHLVNNLPLTNRISFIFILHYFYELLPMIVRMINHSKTNHLTNHTAARRKQFVPDKINKLDGSSFFSASVKPRFLCPGIIIGYVVATSNKGSSEIEIKKS